MLPSPGLCTNNSLCLKYTPIHDTGHSPSFLQYHSHSEATWHSPSPSPCSAFSGFFPFSFFYLIYCIIWASLVTQTVKNLPAMQEMWVRSLGWEDPLENEMATHSSVLAWEIPWTEEPGGLPCLGSQRAGHDWGTNILNVCQGCTKNYCVSFLEIFIATL